MDLEVMAVVTTLLLDCKPTNTVEDVKKLIEEEKGILVEEQVLKRDGRELPNDMTLSEAGITPSEPRVYLEARCLGLELERLAKERGEDIEELRKDLENSFIKEFDRPRSRSFGFNFIDISKGLDKFEWAKSAPKWLIATGGLNYESRCTTKGCEAFDQQVIVQRGYGTFDVSRDGEDNNKCPCCKEDCEEVTACWLSRCRFSWTGTKYKDTSSKETVKCSGGPDVFGDHGFRTKQGVECFWKKLVYIVERA